MIYCIVLNIRAFVLGLSTKKLIPKHSKNLKNFFKKLDQVQSEHLGKKIEGWFGDEAHSDYDDLCCAAIEAWQEAALDPELITSVCRAKYAERIF